MIAAAWSLMEFGVKRRLHLFDTFEEMSEPTAVDMNFAAVAAKDYMVEAVCVRRRALSFDNSAFCCSWHKKESLFPRIGVGWAVYTASCNLRSARLGGRDNHVDLTSPTRDQRAGGIA
jgi:hypothetical protein